MKPMLKRIFPFVLGGAVVVFAACQDNSQNLTEPVVPLEGRGGPTLQSQINQVIKLVWPNGHDNKKQAKKAKATMFGAGPGTAAAQAAATEMIELALVSGADMDDVQDLVDLVSQFSGLTQGKVVEAAMGGIVTDETNNGPGFAGVQFQAGDLPENAVVIIDEHSQPCHPLSQLPNQEDGCFSFRTIPEMTADFNNPVLIGVCTNEMAPNFPLLRLFESQGPNNNSPVVLLPEEPTPAFLVPDCLGFGGMANTESSWLGDFANAGWDKIGRPLASFFAPQPLFATALVGRAGSLGGRTKNFSNIGWAEAGLSYGTNGYSYLQLDRENEDTPPAGFETPGFDDSNWDVGGAPFWDFPGSASCAIPTGGTTWTAAAAGVVGSSQATEILLRKSFFLPENATNVKVAIAIDNDTQGIWVNGTPVSVGVVTHEGCAEEDSFMYPVADGILTESGENLLVIRAIDRGVMSYVDAQVTFDTNGGGE